MSIQVVAVSGGKDSTCMALRLREVEPETSFVFFCTPTGDELPEMDAHWQRVEALLEQPLLRLTNGTLYDCIEKNRALPNHRMRFCTRQLKIEPCLKFLVSLEDPVLCVGLRADEPERKGLFSHEVTTRFPLREWGWGLLEVKEYLREREIKIPRRTECALCFHQRLSEWESLLRHHPERWEKGQELEEKYGNSFRSPGRDSKPSRLQELRMVFERQPVLEFAEEAFGDGPCRVCSL